MKKIFAFVAVSAFCFLSVSAFAGSTRHVMPGVACDSYNNSQADRMTRDHARMFLPADGPSTGLWIVCPVQAVEEDLLPNANPPQGNVTAFFDAGVPTGTQVTCIIRSFPFNSTHVPGDPSTPQPTETLTAVITKTAGNTSAQANFDFFQFLQDYEQFGYYTVTCKLYPGTGLNSIDFLQW